MSNTTNCNHIIGYIERNGYDGAVETDFQYLNDLYLDSAKEIKSQKNHFNFCSSCGHNLEGLLDQKIQTLQDEKDKRAEEEKAKKIKAEKAFEEKVLAKSKETRLNQLPEEGNFVVIFHPTNYSCGKNIVINGQKQEILRNCALSGLNSHNPDPLIVKNIYEVFSPEEFLQIMQENEFITTKEISIDKVFDTTFFKTNNNKRTELSMSRSGTIYISNYDLEDDPKYARSYDHFVIHRLGDYLKKEIALKEIVLK